jgi:hypothetical protein
MREKQKRWIEVRQPAQPTELQLNASKGQLWKIIHLFLPISK